MMDGWTGTCKPQMGAALQTPYVVPSGCTALMRVPGVTTFHESPTTLMIVLGSFSPFFFLPFPLENLDPLSSTVDLLVRH